MKKKLTFGICTILCISMFFMLSTRVNNAEVQDNVSHTTLDEFVAMRSSVMVSEKPKLSFVGNELDLEDCEFCGIGDMSEEEVVTTTTTVTTTTKKVTTTTPKVTTKPSTTTSKTTTKPVTTTQPQTSQTTVTTAPSSTEGTTTVVTTTQSSPSQVSDMAKQIFEIVNQKRKDAGKSGYILDEKLCEIANMRAKELVTKFSHTRPNGKKYNSALDEYSYSYQAVGENIAYGYSSASAVMNKWMSSAPHKANILDSNNVGYSRIGIGYYNNNGTKYYVQMFVK